MQSNYSTNLKDVLKARIFALDELLNNNPNDNPAECPKFQALDPESKQIVLNVYYRDRDDLANEVSGIEANYD